MLESGIKEEARIKEEAGDADGSDDEKGDEVDADEEEADKEVPRMSALSDHETVRSKLNV